MPSCTATSANARATQTNRQIEPVVHSMSGRNSRWRLMGASSDERRLGGRYEVEGVAVGWRLDRKDDRPVWRRRSPLPPEAGELLNVSVTGASVLAPATKELMVGSRVLIEIMGVTEPVKVRRIGRSRDSARSIYGIEFLGLHSNLRALICEGFLGEPSVRKTAHPDSRP